MVINAIKKYLYFPYIMWLLYSISKFSEMKEQKNPQTYWNK